MNSKISIFILSLLFCIPIFSQNNDIRILSSDRNSILVEYNPEYSDTFYQVINNRRFVNISLVNGIIENPANVGLPAVNVKKINIGVPSEFGNTIQILSNSYKIIKADLAPIPDLQKDENGNAVFVNKISSEYYSYKPADDLVKFGNFGIARGIPLQTFIINPINYDPQKREIKLYNKIIFRVNFSSNQKLNNNFKDELLSGTVINYDVAKNWAHTQKSLQKVTAVNSVLASGTWYRFEVNDEGFYKITHEMLSDFGINPANVDPRTIKIYNNGGKTLPETVMAPAPDDLVENAIIVVGEDDGSFDQSDYILFYGRTTNFWEYDSTVNKIVRRFHPYSKENYYWITSGGNNGKRITVKQSLQTQSDFVQTTTKAFAYLDEEKINLPNSGRYWLGDEFNQSTRSRTFMNKLDNFVGGSTINYKFRFINSFTNPVNLKVSEHDNQLFYSSISGTGITAFSEYNTGYPTVEEVSYTGNLPENRSLLKFEFNATGAAQKGYIDYFEIRYLRNLKAVENKLIFFSPDSNATIEYYLSDFSNSYIHVFDVTDYANVKEIKDPNYPNGGDFRFTVNENDSQIRKYIGICESSFKTPVNPVKMPNSNIHGISDGGKLIIVTNKDFKDQAERYKSYRENESNIKYKTQVVYIDEVFNEFSGGLQDISGLRNFIKYAYNNWSIKPEYVLLFGDGTYDYKDIEGFDKNYVITYQTVEHLHGIYTATSDDFFVRVEGNDLNVDLAIGRVTIQSPEEGDTYIDKVIKYEKNTPVGVWRNLITLVADDMQTSKGTEPNLHTPQSEQLANNIIPQSFNLNKVYLAAYPTVLTGFGRTKPAVNQAIINSINQGTLILNYIGHGNPETWAHERVFEKSSTIPQLVNDKYFFLTAATCDFGYYDLPNLQSSAEVLLTKKESGAIGVFTSARVVFSFSNARLNEDFYGNLLNSQRDTMNLPITVGKAYFLTKQFNTELNDQKFHLLGDPTVRLLIPQYRATIDSINGSSLSQKSVVNNTEEKSAVLKNSKEIKSSSKIINPLIVQIKALSNTSVEGTIKKPDGTDWTDFNGEAIISVFDSKRTVNLEQLNNYAVTMPGGTIFRGRISVINGNFNSQFVVPKDISYENQNGKIIVYFFDNNRDGLGYTNNVIVGGTDSTAVNDGEGPEIDIFFDDENYNSGNLTTPNADLIVKLFDGTGLNTTGTGVGHKLEGILNDNENEPIDFTNYFTGELDAGGKSGKIVYPFSNLEMGDYKLDVTAWDVFNNFSQETTYFTVVTDNDLVVRDIYNYPNPFASNTTFTFQQNLNKILDVKIKIYTVAGRLIKNIEKFNIVNKYVTIGWDGRDQDGNQIANGTYLYKLIVKTSDGEFSKSYLGKIAVIR